MINAKQLGYRIRLEREKNHLTQEQLGAAINYTKQQISNWEEESICLLQISCWHYPSN